MRGSHGRARRCPRVRACKRGPARQQDGSLLAFLHAASSSLLMCATQRGSREPTPCVCVFLFIYFLSLDAGAKTMHMTTEAEDLSHSPKRIQRHTHGVPAAVYKDTTKATVLYWSCACLLFLVAALAVVGWQQAPTSTAHDEPHISVPAAAAEALLAAACLFARETGAFLAGHGGCWGRAGAIRGSDWRGPQTGSIISRRESFRQLRGSGHQVTLRLPHLVNFLQGCQRAVPSPLLCRNEGASPHEN